MNHERDLISRLNEGSVICAEGYLFELERRGYLSAGAYVPEVVLDHPEVVTQLHRDFVHAGSDVVEPFTYYAHREKLRQIGKENLLEPLNRQALQIAKEVSKTTNTLLAGNICNTNTYIEGDAESHKFVRAMYDEQIGWAIDSGFDYIIAETIDFVGEAKIALEAIKEAKLPAVVTLAIHRTGVTRDHFSPENACKQLEDAGADVIFPLIFLEYSTFPVVAELTIKYPFKVTAYIFPEPITKPVTLVSRCFLFKIFNISVDQIIFPEFLSILIK